MLNAPALGPRSGLRIVNFRKVALIAETP